MTPATVTVDSTLIDHVIQLTHQAGEAILDVYESTRDMEVEQKDDNSPVTRADLAAHHLLVKGLADLTPGVPVLSEESELPDFAERRQWPCYWLVDPLDGTKEFINRNGEFTVNVALIQDGIPVLGVVHVPVKHFTYAGSRALGAWKIEGDQRQSIQVRSLAGRGSADRPVELVASRRHGADAVQQLLKALGRAFGEVNTKDMGSSLKLCLVAEGAADLYPRLAPTSEWDTAAAQAVVEAAGGTVVDTNFDLLRYNTKEDILNPYFYVIGDTTVDWQALLSEAVG